MLNFTPRNMTYWIRAYNHRQYRVADFIRDHGFIDWGMHNHFEVGDMVFLYATDPESRLTFMMEVTATGLSWHESVDDSAYFISQQAYDQWVSHREQSRYVRFSLLKELGSKALTFGLLMENGLGGAPRSPRRLMPAVIDYILNHL